MKFVTTKTVEQLDLQALRRVRERLGRHFSCAIRSPDSAHGAYHRGPRWRLAVAR